MPYPAVYQLIGEMRARLAGRPALADLFARCFPNTLETTTEPQDDGTTFVFTGDIPAMWLRDSSAQVRPYVRLAARDAGLRHLLAGLIRRQAAYILHDPYANAFMRAPRGQRRQHASDRPAASPWVWERKFELDSLCYPLQLLHDYWQATRDSAVFDGSVHAMLQRIVAVMRVEQRHDRDSPYWFERPRPASPLDTLTHGGHGPPSSYTGMVWSGFRPSDDACAYGYLIPANMFAVAALRHVVEIARAVYDDRQLAEEAARLRDEIDRGIHEYGLVDHPRHGRIYAYETDGRGNHTLMDDANVPSLLSIPYLGYRAATDEDYRRTRGFVLSGDNPYYVVGRYARGVGSPHTPRGYVWPLALAMQGLTATDRAERDALVEMLATTTAGTDYMHESVDPDDPTRFTRPWFAWANSLCAEFLLRWVEAA